MLSRRRRGASKPRPKPAPEPVEEIDPRLEAEYHQYNPMRDNGVAVGECGPMPHELESEYFIEFLILNGMTEQSYWISVEAGEGQALDIEKNGMPLRTDQLTHDQKGWAKSDHFEHFQKEIGRWRPVPGKASKVVPFYPAARTRDRQYRNACDCETPSLELWGYRWDLRELLQCQNCGEVIAARGFNTNNHDDEEEDEYDNEVVE